MAKFLENFMNKIMQKGDTGKANTENIPPLYSPKSNFVGAGSEQRVGYSQLNNKNGVLMQMPNGELLHYISKNKDNNQQMF